MSYAASTSTSLEKNQIIVWQGRRGAALDVLRGRVWVTASNRLDDHFLDAGQQLALPARSRVVISGECAATISIRVAPRHLPSLLRLPLARLLRQLLVTRRHPSVAGRTALL